MVEIIEDLFDDQPVEVAIEDIPELPDDQLVLRQDEEIVATSPINEFLDSVLLTDSTGYVTGHLPLSEVAVPDVIRALEETTFKVDTYRKGNREKLLFIAISRYVEKLAFEGDGGTLRTGFQELSRMRDESGTAEVYKTLGQTDVDVHVYGVPDWVPGEDFGVTIHGGYDEEFSTNWFVVYEPPAEADHDGMAFLSTEIDSNQWEGFWSTDADLIAEISDYLAENL